MRRPGAAALDLCYVAAGRLDAFWETGLAPWDLAAGSLIIREAGGIVSASTAAKTTSTPATSCRHAEDLRRPRQALRPRDQSHPGTQTDHLETWHPTTELPPNSRVGRGRLGARKMVWKRDMTIRAAFRGEP